MPGQRLIDTMIEVIEDMEPELTEKQRKALAAVGGLEVCQVSEGRLALSECEESTDLEHDV